MGFILPGVHSRHVKKLPSDHTHSVHYPYRYRYRNNRSNENLTQKRLESDERLKVSKRQKTNTIINDDNQGKNRKTSNENFKTISTLFQNHQKTIPKNIQDLPMDLINKIFVYSGRNSKFCVLNKALYNYFHDTNFDFHFMNQYIKYNYTRNTEDGMMIFDLRVFDCERTRNYLMYIGLANSFDDEYRKCRRMEAIEYIFDKKIKKCINRDGYKTSADGTKVSQLRENEFPKYFLNNAEDLNTFFMPHLQGPGRNIVFDKIMYESKEKIHLKNPEVLMITFIKKTFHQVYGIESIDTYFMKILEMTKTEISGNEVHLSSRPLAVAVQMFGKDKTKFQELWSALLETYIVSGNEDRFSDDELWYILVSDQELVLPHELIWAAGGRPSFTVMNNV